MNYSELKPGDFLVHATNSRCVLILRVEFDRIYCLGQRGAFTWDEINNLPFEVEDYWRVV